MSKASRIIIGLVLAAVVAAASLSGPATAQTPPASSYLKNFDNYVSPDAPLPLGSDGTFDVFVHSRERATWGALDPMTIDHGSHCEGPPATHPSSQPQMQYSEASFICSSNPHWMTALRANGYGLIYGTPNHMADFSQGEAVIRFDVSTLRTSQRDWIDVWVTPWEENLAAPLHAGFPDLVGEPRRSLNAMLGTGSAFSVHVTRDLQAVELPYDNRDYATFLVPSASRRDTVEFRISRTRVKVGMPAYNVWWTDAAIDPPLDWDRGVVQFGHHSYTPDKDCGVANVPGPDGTCRANTWHWDNISVSPSVPFTMIRANERAAVEASAGEPMAFTFSQPAPQAARLRVSAYGDGYQVSTDDGTTWAPLAQQPARWADRLNAFRPYWHPVPAGTQRVLLRATTSGWWGQAGVNYVALWSDQMQQVAPTPTGVPPTATPVPPTDTPTPVPQNTSTPLPTFTSVPPTATTVPPTPTAVPPTGTVLPATSTATAAPQGNCAVTVAPNRKTGSWSCP